MEDNYLITNIPIGLKNDWIKPGLLVTPTIVHLFSLFLKGKSIIHTNIIDSHNDTHMARYYNFKNDLNKMGIRNNVSLDIENIDAGMNVIKSLIEKNVIYEKNETVFKCSCGKVEFSKGGFPSNSKFFCSDGSNLICELCSSVIRSKIKKVLVFKTPKKVKLPTSIPNKYEKQINNLIMKYEDKEILISKSRDTKIYCTFFDTKYNIDIEFLNFCILASLNHRRKLIVSSNHSFYHQALTYFIDYQLNNTPEYFMFFTAYIINPNGLQERRLYFGEERIKLKKDLSLKLLILNSISWKKGEYKWNIPFLDSLNKYSNDDLETAFRTFIEDSIEKNSCFEGTPYDKILNCFKLGTSRFL